MRTQRVLYSGTGVIYPCELERCPGCDGDMQTAFTSKYKTVQTMHEVLRIGQRTKRCINPECEVCAEIWGSMQWRQIALLGCTYGYDVIAQIGWQRQTLQQPFALIHSTLQPEVRISEAQVRVLYHERYHHSEPDEIDSKQIIAVIRWVLGSEQPVGLAVMRERQHYRQGMDQEEMNHVKEERHPAEGRDRSSQRTQGPIQ